MNVFYFNNNKDTSPQEKIKIFQNIFDKKMISPLNLQANKRNYEKPFKCISWSDSHSLEGKELKFQPCFLKQNIILKVQKEF